LRKGWRVGIAAEEVVRRLGGHAAHRDIARHSSAYAVRAAFLAGELRRVGRGYYALPEPPSMVHAAVALGGVLSHSTAAEHWQLEFLHKPTGIHVTVPRNAHRKAPKGVTLHYSCTDCGGDVTPPLRTILDCARTLSFPEALAIADSACRRGLVNSEELVASAAACRGNGRRQVATVAAHADARAANPFESALRAVTIRDGLLGFEPQLPVGLKGRTVFVDLGDPKRRIVLEADSFAYHGTRSALERDCRRYDELVGVGWRVLRFSWEHVMFEQEWVSEMLRATCSLPTYRR
jgi:very-short-patch-repair endonuclease